MRVSKIGRRNLPPILENPWELLIEVSLTFAVASGCRSRIPTVRSDRHPAHPAPGAVGSERCHRTGWC